MRICTIDGCEKPLAAQGMCHMHRNRVRRNGNPNVVQVRGGVREIKPPTHGTQRAYQSHGCRCDICVEAQRARARAYYANYRERVAEKRLIKAYGMDAAAYGRMLAEQSGVCLICGDAPDGKPLFVDHCHATGAVRGLLCTQCNTGLGMFGDDPSRLLAAAAYLMRNADVLGELA